MVIALAGRAVAQLAPSDSGGPTDRLKGKLVKVETTIEIRFHMS
ncbi:MAG TPA: hypothetical protein VKU42_11100 [Candidatus Angelobacter sp.]|nr:hypothetical protein [Candidatus Angelobacter sp.]